MPLICLNSHASFGFDLDRNASASGRGEKRNNKKGEGLRIPRESEELVLYQTVRLNAFERREQESIGDEYADKPTTSSSSVNWFFLNKNKKLPLPEQHTEQPKTPHCDA